MEQSFLKSFKTFILYAALGAIVCACEKIDKTPELTDPLYKVFSSELEASQKAKEKMIKDLDAAIKSRDAAGGSEFAKVGFRKEVNKIQKAISRANQDILYKQIRVKKWAMLVRRQYLNNRNSKPEGDTTSNKTSMSSAEVANTSHPTASTQNANSDLPPNSGESTSHPTVRVDDLPDFEKYVHAYEMNQRLRKSPRDWSHRVPKAGKKIAVAKPPPAAH